MVAEIVEKFGWTGPVGVTLPCVVKTRRRADRRERGQGLGGHRRGALFARRLGRTTAASSVLNDADAAGMAEVRYGAGKASPASWCC